MDTRTRLEAIARQNRQSFIAVVGGRTIATATQDEQETADELVHRWNAYPSMLAALGAIRDGLNACETTDELRNTAGMCIVQARAAITNATNTHDNGM